MAKIDVKTLTPGGTLPKALGLDNLVFITTPDVPVDDEDLQLLNQWKIRHVELADLAPLAGVEGGGEDSGGDPFEHFQEERDLYHKALQNILDEMERFFQEIRTRGSGKLKPITDQVGELLSIVKRARAVLLVMVNMRLGGAMTIHEQALYTAIYALVIGETLGLEEKHQTFLYECAALINVGMLRRDIEMIVNKNDKLTPGEIAQVRTHPTLGAALVKEKLRLPPVYATMVETHAECMDGSGYPKGLTGDKIHTFAKILGVAEEFVALCDDKPYRKKMTLQQALRTLIGDGRKKFDQKILQVLLANLSAYPLGSAVELSDGRKGVVVGANAQVPLRPKVRVVMTPDMKPLTEKKNLDLLQEKGLTIKFTLEDEALRRRVYGQL